MIELTTFTQFASIVLQEGSQTPAAGGAPALEQGAAVAIGVGLAALGSGYAERGIGAAAIGAIAEDSISFPIGLVMTVLPETLVILALLPIFLG